MWSFHQPDVAALKIWLKFCTICGIHPSDLIEDFTEKPTLSFRIYSMSYIALMCMSVTSMLLALYHFFSMDSLNLSEIADNLAVLVLICVSLLRQYIIRTETVIPEIITFIARTEKYVLQSKDEDMIRIFAESSRKMNLSGITYMTIVIVVAFTHFLRPFFIIHNIHHSDGPREERAYMISIWFPYFESEMYFWFCQFMSIVWSAGLVSFQVCTDVFVFSLILFTEGQLKILHHIMNNFEIYRNKLIGSEAKDSNEKMMIRCILNHRQIIRYLDLLNSSLSTLMVLDFLQASVQFTCVLSQLALEGFVAFRILIFVPFLCMGMFRMFINYYFGNEIIILSTGLVNVAYFLPWYEESPQFKYMIRMFMMRCSKPLSLQIGAFSTVALPALLTVSRATYSYLMLLTKTANGD